MRLEILPLLIDFGGMEFNLTETEVSTKYHFEMLTRWKVAKCGGLSTLEAPKLIALVSFVSI